MTEKKKIIQLSEEDFREISTDVAGELLSGIPDHGYALFSALLLAGVCQRLFNMEKLIIEEEEN